MLLEAPPAAVVLAIAMAHLRLAATHPAHAVLMWDPDLPDPDAGLRRARTSAVDALTTAVHQAAPSADASARSTAVWALVHGMVTALRDGTAPAAVDHPPDAVLEVVIGALLPDGSS